MNRFDDDFHDVDPATGRPFSAGHPDGVWIISIVLGFVTFVVSVAGLLALLGFLTLGEARPMLMLIWVVSVVLFVPAIVLLFRRKKAAAFWFSGMAALALALVSNQMFALQRADSLTLAQTAQMIAFAGSFVATAAYTIGLRRDRLLD